MVRIFGLCAAFLFIVSCGGTEGATKSSENSVSSNLIVELTDGFINAPIPGKTVTSAGITVNSNKNIRLINARMEGARVELHTMSMTEGRMRMRSVDGFDITANVPFALGASGPHFMVYGLDEVPESTDIELEFRTEAGQNKHFTGPLLLRKR